MGGGGQGGFLDVREFAHRDGHRVRLLSPRAPQPPQPSRMRTMPKRRTAAASDFDAELEPSESEAFSAPDDDPIDFWEKKQRELVTSVVDYNLSTLAEITRDKTIDLAPRYQRRFRWDAQRQSKLIESFLMNVPIPPIFLNEDSYGQYSVIDGKQRLTAVTEFMLGRLRLSGLTVFSDINGLTFDELPSKLQAVLKTRPTLRAVIVLRQSDVDVKFEVFRRLNTGGVKLNAQEIRNSTYPGTTNNLILDLSEHPELHAALGIKVKAKSPLYREMRDAEFVVRYLTFRDSWQDVSGGMRREMDRFMAEHQNETESWILDSKRDFLEAVASVVAAFGTYAFRRWQPDAGTWRKQVLASLFDAQMFACRDWNEQDLVDNQPDLIRGMKKLFKSAEFRKSIDAATNTPSYFKRRIELVSEMIEQTI